MKNIIQFYRHCRAGGMTAGFQFWSELGSNHLHVLSTSPPVVYLWWGRDDELLHEGLKGLPLIILYMQPWYTPVEELPGVAAQCRERLQKYPGHRIIFLCNEEESVEPLVKAGVEALFVNHNAFINENVFRPLPAVAKTHDAIYSASMASYKRHELAGQVSSLIMLGYVYYRSAEENAYRARIKEKLQHALWAKDFLPGNAKFTPAQMAEWCNRAHVGLCLSAVEGAMFASMEYLLCGLPVVSTKSKGGRDVFWDDRYAIVCEDRAEAVAEAVQELKHRAVPAEEIRRLALEKMAVHRRRLQEYLRPDGVVFDCPWPPGGHGISTFSDLKQVARSIRRGVMPSRFL